MQLLEGRVGAQSVLAVMVAVMVAVYCRPKLSLHIHAPHATNTLPDPIDSSDFGDTHTNKRGYQSFCVFKNAGFLQSVFFKKNAKAYISCAKRKTKLRF